jgi:hypothetical protein
MAPQGPDHQPLHRRREQSTLEPTARSLDPSAGRDLDLTDPRHDDNRLVPVHRRPAPSADDGPGFVVDWQLEPARPLVDLREGHGGSLPA